MLIAIIGLPNKGKSTLFNALTLGNAAIANYPFTTIDPNKGVAFVSSECPHVHLQKACNPDNSKCEDGIRKIPVNVIDVAGLVEGAHEGKGMGNQFLADVAAADCAIIVADASGATDDSGSPTSPGSHDVLKDVALIESELLCWYKEVLKRNALKNKGKKLEDYASSLSGLKILLEDIKYAIKQQNLNEKEFWNWSDPEFDAAAELLMKRTKPLTIAANKIDSEFAEGNTAKLEEAFPNYKIFPISADSELALRKATEKGLVKYRQNTLEFENSKLPEILKNALEKINNNVLKKYGSTGVQNLLNYCVFDLLQQIVLYPVEDEVHFSNHFGKVLPDTVLLKKGSKAHDLAAKIHTDLAKGMLYAVDAEKKMRIAKDAELHDKQIVKIVSSR